jgi:hypothetical protein
MASRAEDEALAGYVELVQMGELTLDAAILMAYELGVTSGMVEGLNQANDVMKRAWE